jgi:acetyl esterase
MSATIQARLQSGLVRGLAALPHPVLRALVGRPVAIDDQRLHVEAQLGLKLLSLARAPQLCELTPEQARSRVAQDAATFAGPAVELGRVQQLEIDGNGTPLRARLYVPAKAPSSGPLLVYYHGGGFVVGDLDTHDNSCRFLARQAGVRMLAIDYRLAPEHPFPAAFDDALAAFRFATTHAHELGADPQRIAVGGDSAGGNLAAGVAQLAAADERAPAFALLLYPWLDLAEKRSSYRLFGDRFYLTKSDLDWYRSHYLAAPAAAADPRCSPLRAEDLKRLPPTYIATAGFDPLRDEGEEYAARLQEAGVQVALRRHPGLIHGFFNTVAVGHAGREAMIEAAGALRMGLAARS